jgi:hypothetical protein
MILNPAAVKSEDPKIAAWRKSQAEACDVTARWFKQNEPLIDGVDQEELVALGLEDDCAFNGSLLRSKQSLGPSFQILRNPVSFYLN